MSSQQQEMINACTSGDVQALQQLFKVNSVEDSEPVYTPSADGPPPANSMLAAAITNGQLDVVSLILKTYSKTKVQFTGETIEALVRHPNLDILQAVYDYDRTIVSFEWDNHTDTFVTKACEQPPEKITPLLRFLIEHDADLEAGYFPRTLCNAILGGQTLGVIETMIEKGVTLSTQAMRQAVVCERVDVIKFFVDRGVDGDADDAAYLRSEAEQTGNADVMDIVQRWTSNGNWVSDDGKSSRGPGVAQKLKRFFTGRD
ncbi:hypothetical protein C7974DRAFT_372044 [Boeremia exigua]|uniref:uncharacterized protein n=1 Tax=Boeremia exigua TaxID=749465 RepID=UPI001E8D46B1|nr:uncharacterized protein C7974DRAFT_372044 [Boeremia exigua]KAH6642049.1 hypothetical protein C7974DRAFT_372044 [Boeremia exigua]